MRPSPFPSRLFAVACAVSVCMLLCSVEKAVAVPWQTSKDAALLQAAAEGKLVLLVAGRDT